MKEYKYNNISEVMKDVELLISMFNDDINKMLESQINLSNEISERLDNLIKESDGNNIDELLVALSNAAGEIELNKNFIMKNIIDATKLFNTIQNFNELISKPDLILSELSSLNKKINTDTKELIDKIKEEINKMGDSWKERLFKEKDFHLKGSFENSKRLNYLNGNNILSDIANGLDKSLKYIKEKVYSIKNGDIDTKKIIQSAIFGVVIMSSTQLSLYIAKSLYAVCQ